MHRFINRWTVTIFALVVIIAVGVVVIAAAQDDIPGPVTFSVEPPRPVSGSLYVDGNVTAPGWYSFGPDDTIADLVSAAGGTIANADINLIVGETESVQKIDINRAEAWLLQALPGIGEERAWSIIDYREANGPFRDVEELTGVEGIGPGLLDDIRPLITVGE